MYPRVFCVTVPRYTERVHTRKKNSLPKLTYFGCIQNRYTFDDVGNFYFSYTGILEHSCNLKRKH